MSWEGSTRRERLPADWASRLRPLVLRTYGDVCHVCGEPGTDAIDHVNAGDDDSVENLRPIHQDVPPFCHRYKTAAEGVAAREALRAARFRPVERHPGSRM